MDVVITTRTLEEQPTAVVEGDVRPEQLASWLAGAYDEIYSALIGSEAYATGSPYACYAWKGQVLHVEAGVPISGELRPWGRARLGRLEGGAAAVALHTGPYHEVAKVYDALQTWVLAHGYEKSGRHREVYLLGPDAEPDPDRWRTEVVVPFRES